MVIEIDDHMAEIAEAGFKFKMLTKEVMEALAAAIDAKDKYTNGHSKRVAEYSRKIAEIAGKSPEECEMIYYAGLLHDVGGNTNKRQYDSILPHYELSDSTSCMALYVFLLILIFKRTA